MIQINDIKVTEEGRTLEVRDGRVYIDGKQVNAEGKEIHIHVQGSLQSLKVDVCSRILVEGDAGSVSTSVGDVEVKGSVKGSVKTMSGDVTIR